MKNTITNSQPYFFKVKNSSKDTIPNIDVFDNHDDRVLISYGHKDITFEQFKNALRDGLKCVIGKTDIVPNGEIYASPINISQTKNGETKTEHIAPLYYEKRKSTTFFDYEYLLSLEEKEKVEIIIEQLRPEQELVFYLYPKSADVQEQNGVEKQAESSEEKQYGQPIILYVDSDETLHDFEILKAIDNFIFGNDKIKCGFISYVQFLRQICFKNYVIEKVRIVQEEKFSESKLLFYVKTEDIFGNSMQKPIIIDMEVDESGKEKIYCGEIEHSVGLDDFTSIKFDSLQPKTKILLYLKKA